ncbi:MAG: hypothetical protein ACE365_04180 [Gammaproteobacteria bacterium]
MDKQQSETKKCSLCGLDKPITDYLSIITAAGTRLGSVCRACRDEGEMTPEEKKNTFAKILEGLSHEFDLSEKKVSGWDPEDRGKTKQLLHGIGAEEKASFYREQERLAQKQEMDAKLLKIQRQREKLRKKHGGEPEGLLDEEKIREHLETDKDKEVERLEKEAAEEAHSYSGESKVDSSEENIKEAGIVGKFLESVFGAKEKKEGAKPQATAEESKRRVTFTVEKPESKETATKTQATTQQQNAKATQTITTSQKQTAQTQQQSRYTQQQSMFHQVNLPNASMAGIAARNLMTRGPSEGMAKTIKSQFYGKDGHSAQGSDVSGVDVQTEQTEENERLEDIYITMTKIWNR